MAQARRRAPLRTPVRVTSDGGLATDPAISADGKWLAYASDRGGGTLNLWIRPLAGGEPRRLTSGAEDARTPAFSPDGRTIAFRSEQGIYAVSVSGGEPRLLAPEGRGPRYSPDGKWLAYWIGKPDNKSELYVAPAAGGPPRRLAANLPDARYPLWSPDGRNLLFAGADDWFTIPAEGDGAPMRTGALTILHIQAVPDPIPAAWWRDQIYFSGVFAMEGRAAKPALWRIPISSALQCTRGAERLTSGTAAAVAPNGAVVYSLPASGAAVWSDEKRLAAGGQPSVSSDGKMLVYRAPDGFKLKNLENGNETPLEAPDGAVISPSGRKVALATENRINLWINGKSEKLCEGCRAPWSWSADETLLLHPASRSHALGLLYAASGEKRDILRNSDLFIHAARFAPDGRWIAVQAGERRGPNRIYIVPFRAGASPARADWIEIGGPRDRAPCWSPDGTQLYFVSERDGVRCIWAQRLDANKRPRGEPFAVRHFHAARLSLGDSAPAAARGRLFYALNEASGDLWTIRP